jgi:hypothetical protein
VKEPSGYLFPSYNLGKLGNPTPSNTTQTPRIKKTGTLIETKVSN